MRLAHESIFSSSIRSFCVAFFSILGVALSFLVVMLFLGGLFSSGKKGISQDFSYEVLPNGEYQRELLAFNAPVVLQIDIQGVIGLEDLTAENIKKQLVESREGVIEGNRVKAILLYINTPGGLAFDSDSIYRALVDYKTRYKVPIYGYVDGICASGGMYIASACDKIYSSRSSIIGSVGVVAEFFNVSELLEKIGVKSLTLTKGKDKDQLNPFRPWKEGEDENFKQIEQFFYDDFVDIVSTARPKLTKEDLIQKYGAKVFPAPESLEYGYIDAIENSWYTVLKDLVKEAKIPEGESYQVLRLKLEKTFLGSLFRSEFGTMKHKLDMPANLDPKLANQYLYLYQPS